MFMDKIIVNKRIKVDKRKLVSLCQEYNVTSLKIFGSIARGEEKVNSDIDILVKFENPISLLKLIQLEQKLSELFARKVDLVTEQALSPYIRSAILTNAREIYELP